MSKKRVYHVHEQVICVVDRLHKVTASSEAEALVLHEHGESEFMREIVDEEVKIPQRLTTVELANPKKVKFVL